MDPYQQITPMFIKQCLLTSESYNQAKIIKQAVKDNKEQLFQTICITISEVLVLNPVNDPNPPMAKLQAVKLSKDLFDIFNKSFVHLFEIHAIQQFIYYVEFGDPKDSNRGSTIFGQNSETQIKNIGKSLVQFTSECIIAWALFFPKTPSGQTTKFVQIYQSMQSKGYKISGWNYYKENFVRSNQAIIQGEQIVQMPVDENGVILKRQLYFIKGCQQILDYMRNICINNEQWVPDMFKQYQNEIIAKNKDVQKQIDDLRSIKREDLVKQVTEQAIIFESLEKDLLSLTSENYMEFREKYTKNKDNEAQNQVAVQKQIIQKTELHQPSGVNTIEIQQPIIVNDDSKAQYLQLEQEKQQIQEKLSNAQKEFNEYKINSQKVFQQLKDQYDLEIKSNEIERQKQYQEKQNLMNQIEKLKAQLNNGIEQQNNLMIGQLKRDIENLKQEKELKIFNFQQEINQYQQKATEFETIQQNLTLQLNLYNSQILKMQNEYQILKENQQKEKQEFQKQILESRQKEEDMQKQLIIKEEEMQKQLIIKEENYNKLYLNYQALKKENEKQKYEIQQNLQQKQISKDIKPKQLQTFPFPAFFQHFPQIQKFTSEEVPYRQKPISNENLELIFPYLSPQDYFNQKPQKTRKGKEIYLGQDINNFSYLSEKNLIFFKRRCSGTQGILNVSSELEFGLSYLTQESQNKVYFTYGLYIKNQQIAKQNLKVEFLEIESNYLCYLEFQQFQASSDVFSKQLIENQIELIEILIESKVIHLQVLTLQITLFETKSFQISIPICICQQIIYADTNLDKFKKEWKQKNTNIVRTAQLKLNKYVRKDIQSILKLIPKSIILNFNRIQDFEQGIAAVKFGGIGKFKDISFLIKFEIQPNNTFFIYLSCQSAHTNKKDKIEQILKGYAFILQSNS
ncbi:unnamed protein product (macronuclear) [Paramecium tetraurelia]|uniref:Uncharacterized protein n=1 Tax=Paramecium tetraurelia TaxID=5888 RepID=A0CG38_PARTE|nr:uncharacterized protein GSPATT00038199001 [Paramecium tetraurelia]CAK69755.1 unnamed protein product [Paramecium tetraurelia]|eukprot:XP_001437152.1 hypothetical protein (macronuclear) [Paramecium tetraurelia strain d4-2]